MGSEVSGQSVADSFANLVYAHQPLKASIPIEVSLVLDGWLRNARHLVVIQLHAVQVACGSNWILRRTPSAVHTVNRCCGCCRCVFTCHCFPCFSMFDHSDPCVVVLYFVAFHLFSFLWLEEFIEFVFPSLFWSSHGLYVWCLMLRPGFHSAAFFAHVSSGSEAGLIAKHHFILLCVSIRMLAAFILSMAVAVILCMYSIHSSSSISAVPISSSVSFMNCLGRNLCSNCYPLLVHHLTLCGLLFQSSPSL